MMRCFLFLFAFMLSGNLTAQHCPYDGAHLVLIRVTGKDGKLPPSVNSFFYLQEVDNDLADSCQQASGLIRKEFLNNHDFVAAYSKAYGRNGYDSALSSRLKAAGVLANGNKMVCLNQAENTCMLTGKSDSNDIYRQRKFEIIYMVNGIEMRKPLPPDFIYSLCTARKPPKNFKPVLIKL